MLPSSRCTFIAIIIIVMCTPFIIFGELMFTSWKERFDQCNAVVVFENGSKKVFCEGKSYLYDDVSKSMYNICFDHKFNKVSTCSYPILHMAMSFIACFSTLMMFCGIIVMASVCWKIRETCDEISTRRVLPIGLPIPVSLVQADEDPTSVGMIRELNMITPYAPPQDPTSVGMIRKLNMITTYAPPQSTVAIGKNDEKNETVLIIQPI